MESVYAERTERTYRSARPRHKFLGQERHIDEFLPLIMDGAASLINQYEALYGMSLHDLDKLEKEGLPAFRDYLTSRHLEYSDFLSHSIIWKDLIGLSEATLKIALYLHSREDVTRYPQHQAVTSRA